MAYSQSQLTDVPEVGGVVLYEDILVDLQEELKAKRNEVTEYEAKIYAVENWRKSSTPIQIGTTTEQMYRLKLAKSYAPKPLSENDSHSTLATSLGNTGSSTAFDPPVLDLSFSTRSRSLDTSSSRDVTDPKGVVPEKFPVQESLVDVAGESMKDDVGMLGERTELGDLYDVILSCDLADDAVAGDDRAAAMSNNQPPLIPNQKVPDQCHKKETERSSEFEHEYRSNMTMLDEFLNHNRIHERLPLEGIKEREESKGNLATGRVDRESIEWWKAFVNVLIIENEMLKKKLRNVAFEKDRAASKPKNDEHIAAQLAVTSPTFDDPAQVKPVKATAIGGLFCDRDQLPAYVTRLQEQCKKLNMVNREWLNYQKETENRMSNLRHRVSASEKKVVQLGSAQTRVAELERALQHAKMQYEVVKSNGEFLARELDESRRQCSDLTGHMKRQEVELEIHRKSHNFNSSVSTEASECSRELCMDPRHSEILSENGVVKHQLKAFQEDFEKEHADLIESRRENGMLQRQLNNCQQKLDGAEATLKKMRVDNEQLKRQLIEVKTKAQKSENLLQSKIKECEKRRHEVDMLNQRSSLQNQPVTQQLRYPPKVCHTPPQSQCSDDPSLWIPDEPESQLLSGTWVCSKCTYVNVPVRTVCEVCGNLNDDLNEAVIDGSTQGGAYIQHGERLVSRSAHRSPAKMAGNRNKGNTNEQRHIDLLGDPALLMIDSQGSRNAPRYAPRKSTNSNLL